MKIYVDVVSGKLLRYPNGPDAAALLFTSKDVLPFEVVFLDGAGPVTSTVLAGGATLKVGIKARPGASALLAFTSAFTVNDEVASGTLSLATAQVAAFFLSNVASGASGGQAVLEVEVSAADESTRETFIQHPCVIRREINATTDANPDVDVALYVLKTALFDVDNRAVAPQFLGYRSEITGRTGGVAGRLDYINDAVMSPNTAIFIKIAGVMELWVLETDSVTAADGVWIVDPVVFNGRKWKRYI